MEIVATHFSSSCRHENVVLMDKYSEKLLVYGVVLCLRLRICALHTVFVNESTLSFCPVEWL